MAMNTCNIWIRSKQKRLCFRCDLCHYDSMLQSKVVARTSSFFERKKQVTVEANCHYRLFVDYIVPMGVWCTVFMLGLLVHGGSLLQGSGTWWLPRGGSVGYNSFDWNGAALLHLWRKCCDSALLMLFEKVKFSKRWRKPAWNSKIVFKKEYVLDWFVGDLNYSFVVQRWICLIPWNLCKKLNKPNIVFASLPESS